MHIRKYLNIFPKLHDMKTRKHATNIRQRVNNRVDEGCVCKSVITSNEWTSLAKTCDLKVCISSGADIPLKNRYIRVCNSDSNQSVSFWALVVCFFCQLLIDKNCCSIRRKKKSTTSNGQKTTKATNQTTLQTFRECKGRVWVLFLGQSVTSWLHVESTHVDCPKEKAGRNGMIYTTWTPTECWKTSEEERSV